VNSLVDTLSAGSSGFKMSEKSELFPKGPILVWLLHTLDEYL